MKKLVIIHGVFNSGKTLVYDLFKKEDSYKYIDISSEHYKLNKKELRSQIGDEGMSEIIPYIKTKKIFEDKFFLTQIQNVMKLFPEYDFIIKPGCIPWTEHLKYENAYHLLILRNPKIGWITSYEHPYLPDFIKLYKFATEELKIWKRLHIIRIEDISNNEIMNQLIKNTDLKKIKILTPYDKLSIHLINHKTIYDQLKIIDYELKEFMDLTGYDVNDNENVNLLLKGKLDEILY